MLDSDRMTPIGGLRYAKATEWEVPSSYVSFWTRSSAKRAFDVLCVTTALFLLIPVVIIIGALVGIACGRPVLFRQERAGMGGNLFSIYKFRTMVRGASQMGPGVTKTGDPRLTPLGRFLRKHKLDELPQLFNVLRGDMSLVGPRPKLPEFENCKLECRPGITGAATLAFANEEEMLKDIPLDGLDQFHISVLSPMKRELDEKYQRDATFMSDLHLLLSTVLNRNSSVSPETFRLRPGATTLSDYCDQKYPAMPGRPTA